jgi:hypothetical protein
MPTTRPTLEPETISRGALGVRGRREFHHPMFFDDIAAVMYRKIDTTPLSATSSQYHDGSEMVAGLGSGLPGVAVGKERGCVVSFIIPSRMTHRPLFAPAGATSERMNP